MMKSKTSKLAVSVILGMTLVSAISYAAPSSTDGTIVNNYYITQTTSSGIATMNPDVDNGAQRENEWLVTAEGFGIAPDHITSPAQRRVMARSAAYASASANLLSAINMQLEVSTSTINDVLQQKSIKQSASGFLKHVEVIKYEMQDDASCRCVVGMRNNNFKSVGQNIRKQEKQKYQTKEENVMPQDLKKQQEQPRNYVQKTSTDANKETYSGIIVDATGVENLEKTMAAQLIADGKVLYGNRECHENFDRITHYGTVSYEHSIDDAKNDKERVGDKPLIIKAKQALSGNNSVCKVNLEITPEDGELIEEVLKNNVEISRQQKVIFVH